MQSGPNVLVGHSYGGAVITGAATAAPNVEALVYITAFGLDEGESLESLSKQGPPSPVSDLSLLPIPSSTRPGTVDRVMSDKQG